MYDMYIYYHILYTMNTDLCVYLLYNIYFFWGDYTFISWTVWVEPQSWATKPSEGQIWSDPKNAKVACFPTRLGPNLTFFRSISLPSVGSDRIPRVFSQAPSHHFQHTNINIHIKTCIVSELCFSLCFQKWCDQFSPTDWQGPTCLPNATGTYWLVVKVKRKSLFGALGKWNRCSATDQIWKKLKPQQKTEMWTSVSEWRPGGCRVYILVFV